MREKLTVFRVIFIAVSRAISPYTVQKPCNSGVFSTEWMETISACKVLMLVVCGVARCSAFFLLRDLAWCCQILVASHSRRPVVSTLLLTLPQEPQAVARAYSSCVANPNSVACRSIQI